MIQPVAGLLFQRVKCLLRDTTAMCVEVNPGKEFSRVSNSTRCCFGIKIGGRTDAGRGRSNKVEKLPSTYLSLFVAPKQQSLAVAHGPVTLTLPAAFRRAPVQRFVLAIALIDLLIANERKLVVECRPRLIVQAGKNQLRPR